MTFGSKVAPGGLAGASGSGGDPALVGGIATGARVMTLDEAVNCAAALAKPGDVVLLSPGGTSYDAYLDFAERGEHFRQLVLKL